MFRSPRIPIELIDKTLDELANDPERPPGEIELDLSSCAKASDMLRNSARRARYRKRELVFTDDPDDVKKTVKMWTHYAPLVAPLLQDFRIIWTCSSIWEKKDVVDLIGRLSKAVLYELKLIGIQDRFPTVLHQLASKTTIRDLSLRNLSSVPFELLTYRPELRTLEIQDSQIDWADGMCYSSDATYVFDMKEEFDTHGIRYPSSLTLGLDSTLQHEDILLETYSRSLTDLTLIFRSCSIEYLDDFKNDIFGNVKHLTLEFADHGTMFPRIDIASWVEKRGGSGIEELTVCFSYDCDILEDVLDALLVVTFEGPPYDAKELFDAKLFPKLATGKIIMKFPVMDYPTYDDCELDRARELANKEAQRLFGGETSISTFTVEGLIVWAHDPIWCFALEEDS